MPDARAETCTDLANQATLAITPAAEAANSGCATDDDCFFDTPGPAISSDIARTCVSLCPFPESTSGSAALATAIEAQNAGPCGTFFAIGCTQEPFGCPAVPGVLNVPVAQCIAGSCFIGLPAARTAFRFQLVVDHSGSGDTLPGSCFEDNCTSWTVTPDGQILTATQHTTKTAKLSASDFATIDGILRDPAFRQQTVKLPFVCPVAASDAPDTASFVVERPGIDEYGDPTSSDSSGCIVATAPANAVKTLYDAIKSY